MKTSLSPVFLWKMDEKIIILDFGSQYTQLIALRIRELGVYCEIHPYHHIPDLHSNTIKGVVLSGGPASVDNVNAPDIVCEDIPYSVPVLGICYGAQLFAKKYGGSVVSSKLREYGQARLNKKSDDGLLEGVEDGSQVWMSHADTISELPADFRILASTDDVAIAAYRHFSKNVFGVQFHPEVTHTEAGKIILYNFISKICGCRQTWTPSSFIEETTEWLKSTLREDKVVMGLSGGVDSTVAASLLHKSIGERLFCIFVDSGLLRKNEAEIISGRYKNMGFQLKKVDAKTEFMEALEGISDPEEKRKRIGHVFINVFNREASSIEGVSWLGQGTIYPDVIESVSVNGPSAVIKSHHNVGGLPEKMHLKVIEPLRNLFKDEVRKIGEKLSIDHDLLYTHPFPGPGLAIRILGEMSEEKINILREADDIFISLLKERNLYREVWQSAAILLPVRSVGVMGDERTYEYTIALRAVTSTDGMTADWARLPHEFLAEVSGKIINRVRGVNRVVYDISSKPPATIEWE